jgi:hypothetical protein
VTMTLRESATVAALRGEVSEVQFAVKVQLLAAQAEIRSFYKPYLSEIESILQLLDSGTDAGTAEAERRLRSFRSKV